MGLFYRGESPGSHHDHTQTNSEKYFREKIKKKLFSKIFIFSHASGLAGLDASALWPAHPSDLLRLISSDHSQLIASPASQLQHYSSPQDPQLPCAGCGQPPQLCRIFPARPQLIGCAADIPGTASAHDQPGSTAPSLQIILHSLSRSDVLCRLSALWPVPS